MSDGSLEPVRAEPLPVLEYAVNNRSNELVVRSLGILLAVHAAIWSIPIAAGVNMLIRPTPARIGGPPLFYSASYLTSITMAIFEVICAIGMIRLKASIALLRIWAVGWYVITAVFAPASLYFLLLTYKQYGLGVGRYIMFDASRYVLEAFNSCIIPTLTLVLLRSESMRAAFRLRRP